MHTTEQEAAIAAAENAVRARPTDFAAYEALGFAYFEAERYEEAMTALKRAIDLNPAYAPAFEKIGHIHYRIESPLQEAIDAYERAIAIDPHYTNSYYGLGILHATKTGEYDRAIIAFERGLAANPADAFLTASLGSIYGRQGQIDRAIEILEGAVKLDPNMSFTQGWLALLYLHLHQFDKAEAACRREIELEDNHSSHRLLGYIYHAQGRNKEAISELERAVKLEPRDYEARAALAKVYRVTGNLPASQKHYDMAWELAKQDNEYGQACFHAVYGNIEQALTLLETGCAKGQVQPGWIRIDPEFAFIQDEPRFEALIN